MTDWWAEVPAARELPSARRVAERSQLVAVAARPARSFATRPLALAAGGLALASVTGAAVAILGADEATNRREVRCHTTVEVARGVDFAGTGVELREPLQLGAGQRAEAIREAVGLCADLWRQGVLRLGEPNALGPTGQVEEVPPLTPCLTEDGVAAVFPTNRDVCTSLGMLRLDP
jgi:hypothetical protein